MSSSAETLLMVPHDLNRFIPILRDTDHGEMLILPDYPLTVKHIADIYHKDPRGGALITGQPGNGKTTFLAYLLGVLLSLDDSPDEHTKLCSAPILLYTPTVKILFYDGQVYTPSDPKNFHFDYIPSPVYSEPMPPVCVLINMGMAEEPEEPKGIYESQCVIFPVQAASPNPILYWHWVDRRTAAMIGLPLWTEDQLLCGFIYTIRYTTQH
ncbi:hypothetical protein BDP27DRAFT_1442407 [Rhodocollybia butyracea]|uniref:Uncharacterized protein n=1 Tax=Rhodocollybia butyracea TaxID=206335 RepID=A0A9P5Q2T8_9AGAR|nr:hypothetical protein BDP27DRAFT_1442407 [Rhodocollybia butyracea]